MKLSILWVGKTRDRRIAELTGEYIERVRRYCRLDLNEVREEARDAGLGPHERVEREGRRILRALRPGEFRVALDQRGREMTSEEFADFLRFAFEAHPAGVRFIFGGPYGLSEAITMEAGQLWALSKMTLTHEMARLVALEQLYRAFTILRGGPYHH